MSVPTSIKSDMQQTVNANNLLLSVFLDTEATDYNERRREF